MIKMASGTEFESYRHTSICVVDAKMMKNDEKSLKTHVFGVKNDTFLTFQKGGVFRHFHTKW